MGMLLRRYHNVAGPEKTVVAPVENAGATAEKKVTTATIEEPKRGRKKQNN